jgi:release factor glutamine methyltransferase
VNQAGTVQTALKLGRDHLETYSETAKLDVQVLLAHLLSRSKSWVLAHPEHTLHEDIQYEYINLLNRLRAGEPLPYVLGYWEFYGRRFKVSPNVLIPRPETEGLIERGLEYIDYRDRPCKAIDVGTGSGCIAITIAIERSNVSMFAIDRGIEALKIAQENASNHKMTEQIQWMQGDLLTAVHARFDLIVANLPYIPSSRLEHLSVAAHEPWVALDGGMRGLVFIKALIMQLPDRLAENGLALLEIDESHGNDVIACAKELFPMADVTLEPDLAGLDRYISINLRS